MTRTTWSAPLKCWNRCGPPELADLLQIWIQCPAAGLAVYCSLHSRKQDSVVWPRLGPTKELWCAQQTSAIPDPCWSPGTSTSSRMPFWSGSVIVISSGLPDDHASLLICIDSWSWILASMALCSQSDCPQASPAWMCLNSCVHGNFAPSCSHLLAEDPSFAECLMIVQFQQETNFFSKKRFTELMKTE